MAHQNSRKYSTEHVCAAGENIVVLDLSTARKYHLQRNAILKSDHFGQDMNKTQFGLFEFLMNSI